MSETTERTGSAEDDADANEVLLEELKRHDMSASSYWKLQGCRLVEVPGLLAPCTSLQISRTTSISYCGVLIGQDDIDLYFKCNVRGNLGEPIARLGSLGWSCFGPQKGKPLSETTERILPIPQFLLDLINLVISTIL